jgi:hypothetical protein
MDEAIVPAPHCIISYTSEDDRYETVRQSAAVLAQQMGARLILYDIDAAQLFASPLPTAWDGEWDPELWAAALDPEALERAGRHAIAAQVREARESGIDAFGWLPRKKDASAVVAYCNSQGCELILMPRELERPHLLDRLRHASVARAVAAAESTGLAASVAVVDTVGTVRFSRRAAGPKSGGGR